MQDQAAPTTSETRSTALRHVNAEALQYSLISPRHSQHPLARATYELWRDEWFATLHELDGLSCLSSDDYTRQDEIGVLSLADRCLSVTALRWVDLSVAADREDSYFRPWPGSALAECGARPVVIVSSMVVRSEWRRASVEPVRSRAAAKALPLAVVTLALAVRRALKATGYAMGVARNDKSVNRIARLIGGQAVGRVVIHGIDSDIMCFRGDDIRLRSGTIDWIWSRHQQEPTAK